MLFNMTTNDDTKVDEIDVTAADWRPTSTNIRAAIRDAIATTAATHDGLVHIADVRKLLPPWATGPQVGAAICHLVRGGTLAHTGRYLPNGNRATRNRTRPAEVYRLARPIQRETTP